MLSNQDLEPRVLERIEDLRRSLRDLERNVKRASPRVRGESIRVVTDAAELAAECRVWQHEVVDTEKGPR